MANNGKALLAAVIAGLTVVGATYWWNQDGDSGDTPRAGCTTVVVTASVEKSALMAEVAKSYNTSDREVDGNCYGISVTSMGPGAGRMVACCVDVAATAPPRPCVARPAGHPGSGQRVGGVHSDRAGHARTEGESIGLARRVYWLVGLAHPGQRSGRVGRQGPP
jgi:hypothetical protein